MLQLLKINSGRKTVLDLIKIKERIIPVGRLDMYTSGALILTNDGDFTYKITHPKNEITKTYNITIIGKISQEEIEQIKNGVNIGEYITKKAKAKILKYDEDKNITRIEIIISEGKNRQVRRMMEAINKKVLALHRSKIGNINVKDIEIGTWRFLKENEVSNLLKNKKC